MMRHFLLLITAPLLFLTSRLLPSERAGAKLAQLVPDPPTLEVIVAVNAFRASRNLPAYRVDSILMTIAQTQADYISSTGVITHFSADGLHPYQRAVAAGYSVAGDLLQGGVFSENIAAGKSLTVDELLMKWQENSMDLHTLISPDLKDAGVGVKSVSGLTYYVLDAGALSDEQSPSPSLSFVPTSVGSLGTQSASVSTSTPADNGSIFHIVQPNEALWNIALAYKITVEQLRLLNNLSTNDIYEGQKLLIQKSEIFTVTPAITITATFGIPTSTATHPVTPTVTPTVTPLPIPPTSRKTGELVLGVVVLTAFAAAGIGSWLIQNRKLYEHIMFKGFEDKARSSIKSGPHSR